MGAYFKTHAGKKILIMDFKTLTTDQEKVKTVRETASMLKSNFNHGEGILLTDMNDVVFSPEFMKEAKEVGKSDIIPYLAKSAVIGVTGLKKILFKGYVMFTKSTVRPFDTEEEALEYLSR